MAAVTTLASIGTLALKIIKLIFILAIMILYRIGFNGEFLGVGGTWNLNEERNPDVEILASGIFIGYFIYTAVSLINYFFAKPEYKYTFVDIVMNVVGIFLWLAVGTACLHYWSNYLSEYWLSNDTSERRAGLALGALCLINGAFFFADSGLSSLLFFRTKMGYADEE
ncbi:protein snakeskin [Holotrichia oblita]|uniref:Protein snakeskin n=2 Tax=Holotrichia oblita TaxID=644536 RepID=A0ACB9SPP8_HOLOL|nr:protein snakeskin [Holotrichia oblita]KAI4457088.1 protein snakeskin [Holotrichia oblita]